MEPGQLAGAVRVLRGGGLQPHKTLQAKGKLGSLEATPSQHRLFPSSSCPLAPPA